MSNTVGRPRLKQSQRPSMEAADEILDAAAELFTTRGYSATSTRRIAESVGLQQASIYHYFATKQSILRTLLLSTVETTLAALPGLLASEGHAAARLHALARFDSAQLLASTWNLGALYLLPEVRGSEFDDFTSARRDLRDAYATLVDEVATEEGLALSTVQRELPFRVVETVISIRMDSDGLPPTLSGEIADAALRALGVASDRWVAAL
ncbi:helix-turn-helix domain-containing protein [Frondihabitans sp. VKM Ac-2883]|uniref:helix-turn-helix domain-containing protein n=1 Tax=Frondihabitans sp. VKM Ac-2883 TaxID=2783823 RepID=UPI00188DC358|nr:TetR/AcrR family transcriptional regulator [Frondihabitans sp. VKM Ac-2883]MBF4575545.1 TetR/AcrR family transcriptional regulator [Frondihabitans sp. VKM Ac-2883]